MTLKLVFPNEEHEQEWKDIIQEMEEAGEKIVPYALKGDAVKYEDYLENARRYSTGVGIPRIEYHQGFSF